MGAERLAGEANAGSIGDCAAELLPLAEGAVVGTSGAAQASAAL